MPFNYPVNSFNLGIRACIILQGNFCNRVVILKTLTFGTPTVVSDMRQRQFLLKKSSSYNTGENKTYLTETILQQLFTVQRVKPLRSTTIKLNAT